MEKRRLGGSDLVVSPIGLGCWQFSNAKFADFWGSIEFETEKEIVAKSIELGVNWFDTAEFYGLGNSERAVAGALQAAGKKPGEVIVATKWLPLGRFAGSITGTIDKRLECLDPYPIDLYQIHFPASFSSIPAQVKRMAALVEAGKIRYVGVSNFSAAQMRTAHRVLKEEGSLLVSNQVRYSLLDRKIEDSGLLETAKELGVAIIAYSPLAQGLLTGRFHRDPSQIDSMTGMRRRQLKRHLSSLEKSRPLIEELTKIGERHEATSAEVALNWLVSFHGDTVVAIPGASKPEQAEHNAHSMTFDLSEEESRTIDELSRRAEKKE
jgi:aryl-alcohol dehydrogenase-like predicted oxidoreductase